MNMTKALSLSLSFSLSLVSLYLGTAVSGARKLDSKAASGLLLSCWWCLAVSSWLQYLAVADIARLDRYPIKGSQSGEINDNRNKSERVVSSLISVRRSLFHRTPKVYENK